MKNLSNEKVEKIFQDLYDLFNAYDVSEMGPYLASIKLDSFFMKIEVHTRSKKEQFI
jgi:hypothetical protein